MARGRSSRAGAALAPAPTATPRRPEDRGARALASLRPALTLVGSGLPGPRQRWCPAGVAVDSTGRRRSVLTETAREHEALVRQAGALVESAARELAAPRISRLTASLRALDAAAARRGAGGSREDAALIEQRRRRILDHEIPAARQEALLCALAGARPFGPPPGSGPVHRYASGTDRAGAALVESVTRLFPRDWLAASRSDSGLVAFQVVLGNRQGRPAEPGWRGSYDHSSAVSALRLHPNATRSPDAPEWAAHELTHRMEALVPGLDRLGWAYRERLRETGGPVADGPGAYAMHVYREEGPEAVSEILACGIQALAASPARFERALGRDTDYRRFVLGVMALA